MWNAVREAYPDIKQFATEVWSELRSQFSALAPVGKAVWEVLVGITKPIVDFVREHPKLVATLLSGAVIWKTYTLAAQGVGVVGSLVRGSINMTQGHLHKLNAIDSWRTLACRGHFNQHLDWFQRTFLARSARAAFAA